MGGTIGKSAKLADDYWVRGLAHAWSAEALIERARADAIEAKVENIDEAVFNGTYSASTHLLAGYALELLLKSACYLHGSDQRRLKSPAIRHDLTALLNEAEALGFVSGVAELRWVTENLTEPHRNHQFRYGGAEYVEMPPIEATIQMLNRLSIELKGSIEKALTELGPA